MINSPGLENDNDIFGMELFYNLTSGMGGIEPESGLFNGNISGVKWKSKNDTIRGYQFTYDGLNRLMQSNYAQGSSLDSRNGSFSEIIKGYDDNGNMLGLLRKYNNTVVDSLNYKYPPASNRILKISDSGTASAAIDDYPGNSQIYDYDANGNMSYDGSKDFSIGYIPILNLPQKLDFGNAGSIFYHYTSTGAKVSKHTVPGSGTGTLTQYIGNIVYEEGKLSYINTDEGRLVAVETGGTRTFRYEYSLKDHLGNSRVVFLGPESGGTLSLVQATSYYPFGLVMNQTNFTAFPGYQKNKYLYNGKELQDDKMISEAVNWYDYGARFYDPQIGRWNILDKKAEKYNSISPYTYVLNNPLKFIDPDGKDVELIIGKSYTKNGEEHKYGHVALRVYGEGYNYVFDFGRYGKTWGLFDSKGEGIMNIYKDGSKYLKDEQSFRNSIGFNLTTTSEEDKKVINYYLGLAKKGKVYNTGAVPGGGGTAYKLQDDYSALNNNCTTKSAEGLDQINENHLGNEYDPRDALENIEANYKEMGFTKRTEYLKGGGVKVTYDRKTEDNKKKEENK